MDALDFVKNFQELLKANEIEQDRLGSLKTVKEALDKDIVALQESKKSLESKIKEDLEKCNQEIETRKANAERNFENERIRLADLSKNLETHKENQAIKENDLRLKESLLNQQQIAHNNREKSLNMQEGKNKENEKKNILDNQLISSALMEIKKENQRLSQQAENNKIEKEGIDNLRLIIKEEQEKNRLDKENNQLKSDSLDLRKQEIEKQNKQILEGLKKLSEETKMLLVQQEIENKRKKDNDDKEKSLKALEVEISFQIAKLKNNK